MRIGKYETNLGAFKHRLFYYLHIKDAHKLPKGSLYWPADGWITDPEEIKRAIMLDDEMGIEIITYPESLKPKPGYTISSFDDEVKDGSDAI